MRLDSPKASEFESRGVSDPVLNLSELKLNCGNDDDEEQPVQRVGPLSAGAFSPKSPRVKDPRVYKTTLCNKFMTLGSCPYGAKCQFAHGNDELRAPLPKSTVSPIFPTVDSEAKKEAKDVSPNTPLGFGDDPMTPSSPKCPDPRLYKTELCKSFNRTGYCRYGLKCQFAHGIQELRPSPKIVDAVVRMSMTPKSIADVEPIAINIVNNVPRKLTQIKLVDLPVESV